MSGLHTKIKSSNRNIIWFFLKPYKSFFIFLFVLSVISALLETAYLAVFYPLITSGLNITSTHDSNFYFAIIRYLTALIPVSDLLISNCILFIILAIMAFFFRILYLSFSLNITSRIVIDYQQKILEKYDSSDYQFFIDNKQGELLYKAYNAPSAIAAMLNVITQFSVEIVLSLSIFLFLLSISWIATIFVILGGSGYYLLNRYLSSSISYICGERTYQAGQKQNVILNEYINGVKQIKIFETSQHWKTQFQQAVIDFWYYWRKDNFWRQAPNLGFNPLVPLSVAVIIIMIRIQDPASFIAIVPSLGAFAVSMIRLMPTLSKFGSYRMQFTSNLPIVEATYQLLQDKSYNTIRNGSKEFEKLNSGIELNDVKFSYKNRGIVLDNISLKIDKYKTTAIVGASGSGKSTIVDLICRLYDPDKGDIKIDGASIKEYNVYSVLRKTGLVSQETFIYNATVKDNITFGNTYSMQEIIEAATLANAHGFIQQFPQGYGTLVGDRGVKLSGGEKQRIAIARAMIRKPELLILDEATSSLDNISEKIVQDAINNVAKKCTALIIAHRLSTIQNADMIYVLDHGVIIESGNHEQLMNQSGKYWNLYNIQSNINENSHS